MSKLLISIALLVVAAVPAAFGQSKINAAGLRMLQDASVESRSGAPAAGEFTLNSLILATVRLAPGTDVADLEAADSEVRVLASRGGLAIVEMPLGNVESLARCNAVKSMSFGNKAQTYLNKARPNSEANKLINGKSNGFDVNYRGTGVVVGMMDSGFDANNVNFLGTDGTTRIARLWKIGMTSDYSSTTCTEYNTAAAIANFGTDSKTATHATHVAGIMAGSYNGTGTIGIRLSENSYSVGVYDNQSVPYYGIATKATMAVGCGSLYEECILLAGEKVLEYAQSQGMPAVFNLSVGSTMGPHDGTDEFSQYLAELGKEMIICIAAGNDGNANISLQKTFTASDTQMKTFIPITDSGVVDTWGNDATAFDVAFAIYDTNQKTIVFQQSVPSSSDWIQLTSNADAGSGYTYNMTFAEAFTDSKVQIIKGVDETNNRYENYIYYDLTANDQSNLIPGLIYTGTAGVTINSWLYTSSGGFSSNDISGWTTGNPNQSINGMACGDNIIVVGSYDSRNNWPTVGGSLYGYSGTDEGVGEVSTFTSYGTTFSGRSLPDLCAPGAAVVSTYNTYYVETLSDDDKNTACATAVSTVNGSERTNYWFATQGTSMATPYVTGVCAQLLQANNQLTVDQAKTYLTAVMLDSPATTTKQKQQWGAGRLSAYQAMLALLGKTTSIANVGADAENRLLVEQLSGLMRVALAGENAVTVTLYTMAGGKALEAKAQGAEVELSTASLTPGVYVVSVRGASGQQATKTVAIQ